MPRRPDKVIRGEIARVIRAAKDASAAEVVIDGDGQIHIVLSLSAPVASPSPPKYDDRQVWARSNEWTKEICGKPKVKCRECPQRQ